MTAFPPPDLPWQLTGNHWLSAPCIHPADASVHAIGILHRGARGAIEFAGDADFLAGRGPALLRPVIELEGQHVSLGEGGLVWERAYGWLPTFSCAIGSLTFRGTIFAPYGRDADVAGLVYALSIENRGETAVEIGIRLDGCLGHRQLRVRRARPFGDAHAVAKGEHGTILLEGTAQPGLAALAVASDIASETSVGQEGTFSLRRVTTVPAGSRAEVAFYLAAGPERDGAEATMGVMRRRGWRDLLAATRDVLRTLEQATGNDALDRLLNRNLLFAYFYAVGRALDDAHFYLMRSRAPWNGHGVTVRDWDALAWTIPAVQLADPQLARELIIRMCELHGYAPGRGVHYFDGTLFEPGFSIEGAAAYAIAVDRYIRDSGDGEIVEDPVIADTLYLLSDDLVARRDASVPLYATEVTAGGSVAPQPYTLHGNAVAALALDVLRRTLDEEAARDVEDPQAVRAAMQRHFVLERDGKSQYAASIDLAGARSDADDPVGSLLWLPLYDAVDRSDSMYRRSTRSVQGQPSLAQRCGRLMGPESSAALQWLRRATLDNGLAAEMTNEDGLATGNGGDAALAGLLAWSLWYCVHALGTRP